MQHGVVPAEGNPSPFPFTLSEALETLRNHPSWNSWRDNNPQAALVGVQFSQESADPYIQTWRLVAKAESSTGYLIGVSKNLSSGALLVNDTGPAALDEIRPQEAPKNPITMQAAVERWRLLTTLEDETPNFLSWGYQAWSTQSIQRPDDTPGIVLTAGQEPPPAGCQDQWVVARPMDDLVGPVDRTPSLSWMNVGRSAPPACADGFAVESKYSFVTLNTTDGRATSITEGSDPFRFPNMVREPSVRVSLNELRLEGFQFDWVDTYPSTAGLLLALFATIYAYPAWKYPAAKVLLAIAGYSKLSRPRLLDHGTRETILDALAEAPGLTITELAKIAQTGWGTIIHHLGVLEHHGLVTSIVERRRRRFFAAGSVPASERTRIGMLRDDRIRQIYDHVQQEPGTIQRDIAQALGIRRSALNRSLRIMEAVGLVTRTPGTGRVHYFARAATPPSA